MTVAEAQPSISCANDRAVWPWQAEPYRLWSLLVMIERFPLHDFGSYLVDFERAMAGLEIVLRPPTENIRSIFFVQSVQQFNEMLTGVLKACADGQVPLSHAVEMQIKDFLARLKDRRMEDGAVIIEHARLTRQAILNDLSQQLFLFVSADRSRFYVTPTAGWEKVIERFGCSFDVEEARKCFALARYTAAVFHLMKIVEMAVLNLQIFLKDKDLKAHFGSVLAKLQHMTQQQRYEHISVDLQPFLPFLREVLTQLHAVKDSWRNKVSHVDERIVPIDTFTDEIAREVHNATLALTKKLADGLPPRATS